jgi:enoyl-CoA hydratase/carnithine racemase
VVEFQRLRLRVRVDIGAVAFGGGFQLALGADIRLVAPDTRMSVMEIKWGLVPDMAGALLMRGLARADVIRELTYTGRVFDGSEAMTLGFATRLCADPRAEALLYAADRAQHITQLVRPSLERGTAVVQDRYIDSSLAYQGAGRVLDTGVVRCVSEWAAGGLWPDLTVLLDLDPETAAARRE